MTGPFGMARRKRRPTVNITPLIDVMFLLLIFFMVSSTFRDDLGIDLSLAYADSATAQDEETHVVTVSADGTYYFGDSALDEGALERSLREAFARDEETTLVVRADRDAAFARVIWVIDVARTIGYERLALPTAYGEE